MIDSTLFYDQYEYDQLLPKERRALDIMLYIKNSLKYHGDRIKQNYYIRNISKEDFQALYYIAVAVCINLLREYGFHEEQIMHFFAPNEQLIQVEKNNIAVEYISNLHEKLSQTANPLEWSEVVETSLATYCLDPAEEYTEEEYGEGDFIYDGCGEVAPGDEVIMEDGGGAAEVAE